MCTINCTKNLSDFAFISCFKHVNSNRWDSYYLGKLNVIAQKLDNFLIREKAFMLDVSLGSEYASIETFVLESIHPEVFRKISFLKGFSKFLENLPWRSPLEGGHRSKTELVHKCYSVKQLLLMYAKLLNGLSSYLEFFDTPIPP